MVRKYQKEIQFFFVSLIGTLIGTVVVGFASLPGFLIVKLVWIGASGWQASLGGAFLICLSFGGAYFLFVYTLLIAIVLARQVLGFKNKEAEDAILSWTGFKIGGYNFLISLAKHLALPVVRTSPLITWFYRAMGAKIGRNTIISTTRLWDCDLIEIGRNCVIGGNVAISAHITTTLGRGILKKVRIGNRVTVGADSMIFPGVTIENNVVIGAGSIVPKDSCLEKNSVYAGVPVKKIR